MTSELQRAITRTALRESDATRHSGEFYYRVRPGSSTSVASRAGRSFAGLPPGMGRLGLPEDVPRYGGRAARRARRRAADHRQGRRHRAPAALVRRARPAGRLCPGDTQLAGHRSGIHRGARRAEEIPPAPLEAAGPLFLLRVSRAHQGVPRGRETEGQRRTEGGVE